MTTATIATPQREEPLLFEGLTWREFKAVEQLLDRPGYRLSFLDGVLEIRRMPGEPHETVKKRIGALVELYLLIAGFDFTPTGSMILESEAGAVKREADESYRTHLTSFAGVLGFEVSRYFAINDRACLNSTVFCKNRDKTS
ncbi:hypothetical protein NDI44_03940 [Trichocoleus sp. DQ-A3]|uniref:hypothetical protein n=1 Tax=Coleofasciculus sp. FACHB-125 TaxID=2692784 RepID=UPI0030D7F304